MPLKDLHLCTHGINDKNSSEIVYVCNMGNDYKRCNDNLHCSQQCGNEILTLPSNETIFIASKLAGKGSSNEPFTTLEFHEVVEL
jgi:hypothetical protein